MNPSIAVSNLPLYSFFYHQRVLHVRTTYAEIDQLASKQKISKLGMDDLRVQYDVACVNIARLTEEGLNPNEVVQVPLWDDLGPTVKEVVKDMLVVLRLEGKRRTARRRGEKEPCDCSSCKKAMGKSALAYLQEKQMKAYCDAKVRASYNENAVGAGSSMSRSVKAPEAPKEPKPLQETLKRPKKKILMATSSRTVPELKKPLVPIHPTLVSLAATRELFAPFGISNQILRAVTEGNYRMKGE